ncbi:NAD-glutamate dehydrogenase [Sphingomonas mesophila]|uniref:NAD-glutamate dehydrogenase n=1 Tax=Sphingomonas mesophila TaxID=2303576 RepID=UPI000E57E115|nr:NAD-glutamate dehydrogenase domain-containing protein [Sphingomonas mesophila]
MTATSGANGPLAGQIKQALLTGALPGELDGFAGAEQDEAAALVAEAAATRKAGDIAIELTSSGGEAGHRRMRLAIINDDMPFLVDSVANAIAARGLVIHRLLHPVIKAERDARGKLVAIGRGEPESVIYIELDRADAKARNQLRAELRAVLADVRAAVADWRKMQQQMRDDAATADGEGAALLNWFADGAMTLLGYEVERPGESGAKGLGIFRFPGEPTDEGGCEEAIRYFERGGRVPLMAKGDRKSSIHRRVPLDLVVVPLREGEKITGVGVHVGLWTSEALGAPVDEVPVLRTILAKLDERFGYHPSGHSGKALRHALNALPHDLILNLATDCVERLVTAAMTLADRPQPMIVLVRSILQGHLFAFVWLPRDELTTDRRLAIGAMIGEAAGGPLKAWTVDLGDGDLALLRFTYTIDAGQKLPDSSALTARLNAMVRGYLPAVEESLAGKIGSTSARRLALTYGEALPEPYRGRYPAEDAAEDLMRLEALSGPDERSIRLYRLPTDPAEHLRLKLYTRGGLVPLSDVVPVLENFGFTVIKETPTKLDGVAANIHEFLLSMRDKAGVDGLFERAPLIESAIGCVMRGESENDDFNKLIILAGLTPGSAVWLRAWFRYLRQTGVSYSIATVVDALGRSPKATRALVQSFSDAHDPDLKGDRAAAMAKSAAAFTDALRDVRGIDDDRILRLLRSVVEATLRTNAFAPRDGEALAFKIESARVPSLPAPLPWREIWVYSPRLEGIHLRGGPVARGGLRWSDRRDDFRTEILGLMKAQLVKNAVIVPTGAKGGFYPKHLPNPAIDRDAWLAEGTESYRIFIRSLLSITDNIVDDKVVHPPRVVRHDGDDPYFVVAADKGTATFSDVANALAIERGFWLGDAFASGGSNGYDHKAMGITAKGAWISVQRHFLEMGIDVQSEPVRVAGCGDMSGDVFGNGMLLSPAIKLIAAFDHRHIFIDPDPNPATSWAERKRMFDLPRSSWDDYDRAALSKGAMIVARSEKAIKLTAEAAAALGLEQRETDPVALIAAILRSPVDLLWFGGIGTYIKASGQTHAQVGDPANDGLRVDASEVRAKAIGEGANLAITQAARIEFAQLGGRINTDFIDNSAGVDCSDNEVNIKIPLNREMREGRLDEAKRNKLLAAMTDEVSELVLEDNRLQSLALSIAEAGGAAALPEHVRAIELLEASGRLDRRVEGLASSDVLLRRSIDQRGLTRPELAVVLSMAKISLQDSIEKLKLADDPLMEPQLLAAFPAPMVKAHGDAIRRHRLRHEIVATKVANRIVNRLGPSIPLSLTEEESATLGQLAVAFLAAERLLGLGKLWAAIEDAAVPEVVRIELFQSAARSVRSHVSDILRSTGAETSVSELVAQLEPAVKAVSAAATKLIRAEVRNESEARRTRLAALGVEDKIVDGMVRLFELDGVFGIAALSARRSLDPLAVTRAYTQLGEALGLDWAQQQVSRFSPADQWERLLVAGLERDFEQLRLEFLSRSRDGDPSETATRWIERHSARIAAFRKLVDSARNAGAVTAPMLAQLAAQARNLLAR